MSYYNENGQTVFILCTRQGRCLAGLHMHSTYGRELNKIFSINNVSVSRMNEYSFSNGININVFYTPQGITQEAINKL